VATAVDTTLLIDTDVHESPPQGRGMKDLVPYFDPHWQRYIKGVGGEWQGHGTSSTYITPLPPYGNRADWNVGGERAGSTVEEMRKQLFDAEGVSIAILGGPNFSPSGLVTDPEFATALASAYNDYEIENWLDKDPRLRGSVHVAAQVPEAAAREIDRVGAHPQIVQVLLPLATDKQWGDPIYRPIWEAALRSDLVVSFHHTNRTQTTLGWPRYFIEWHTMAAPQAAQNQVLSLICSGTFDRYPELKVVMLEGGVTWVHWLIWRLDQQYRELRQNVPWVKRLPSEHIRDNVRVATQPMTEVTTSEFVKLVEMTDTARCYVFATDYPHYDADTPRNVLPPSLPPDLLRRIRYQNALETFPRLANLAN
jgi:predicted TIM-barrel fold metal-dependent hydrolase